eukprot:TRINITY_DN23337_c0_g1_i1.p1 TRINITY_DN23337_c0_g1~~TRINITY_DN23337_c0_g1_i1.p1  ORF type:complete len:1193 (+),score=184.22 TRINITY_DN23337_c0_g1_i1:127-3705(+)
MVDPNGVESMALAEPLLSCGDDNGDLEVTTSGSGALDVYSSTYRPALLSHPRSVLSLNGGNRFNEHERLLLTNGCPNGRVGNVGGCAESSTSNSVNDDGHAASRLPSNGPARAVNDYGGDICELAFSLRRETDSTPHRTLPAATCGLSGGCGRVDGFVTKSLADSTGSGADDGTYAPADDTAPNGGVERDGRLRFERIFREERQALELNRRIRLDGQEGGARFSVAFSGGGVRAAAFQAGALWSLAQSGRLKDVDYLAAVSGGTYIAAAFASHVVEAGEPPGISGDTTRMNDSGTSSNHLTDLGNSSSAVDEWYLGLVAKTLDRMQANWPYLTRDLSKEPFSKPKGGSSVLPRIFDVPILMGMFVVTMLVKPFLYFVLVLVPLTEIIEFFFGAIMRLVSCSAAYGQPLSPQAGLLIFSHLVVTVYTIGVSVVVTFLCWIITGSTQKKANRSRFWFFMKAVQSMLKRVVVIVGLLAWLVDGVMITQVWSTQMSAGGDKMPVCDSDRLTAQLTCADLPVETSLPWPGSVPGRGFPYHWDPENVTSVQSWPYDLAKAALMLPVNSCKVHCELKFVALGILLMLIFALLLMPLFPTLFGYLMSILGPLVMLNAMTGMVRWRVFSSSRESWKVFVRLCLFASMVGLFKYSLLTSTMHSFYKRSLRKAFFARGEDTSWTKLSRNPWCPFMLFTGTACDYKRPGDYGHVCTITFSPLHTGSQKTLYVATPGSRSMSSVVAISGAASDAMVLGRKDQLRFRFWLEMLSLHMGDFIFLEAKRPPFFNAVLRGWRAVRQSPRRLLRLLSGFRSPRQCDERYSVSSSVSTDTIVPSSHSSALTEREDEVLSFLYGLPMLIVFEIIYGMMLVAVHMDNEEDQTKCHQAKILFEASLAITLAAFVPSFFYGFMPSCADFILHSPVIRGIHRVTKFYHVAERPPSLLYVTDGGILDSTGLVELARRRCKRILLVYGGNDPKDTMRSLKKAMERVVEEGIGSFYDPEDPRRDVSETLTRYASNKELPYLHLGILYNDSVSPPQGEHEPRGFAGDKAVFDTSLQPPRRTTGHVFFLKNRLPADMKEAKVAPLLTEQEVNASGVASGSPYTSASDTCPFCRGSGGAESGGCPRRALRQVSLGGCCCDCCHWRGFNFGRRFPNPPTWNQFLTPQLFNSLCRLGYRVTGPALAAATRPGDLERPWEAYVES